MSKQNKILMVQNAEHVQAMRVFAIAKLYEAFEKCMFEREMEVICKQARDMGLYEVAADIRQQWTEGCEAYKFNQLVEKNFKPIEDIFSRLGMMLNPNRQ